MSLVGEFEDVLKSIEEAVVSVSEKNPDMTNYTVTRAYESAIAHYHAIARQHEPRPADLRGLDATLYEAVHRACESRLGRPILNGNPNAPLFSVEDLVACLRRLRKSVDFWTKKGGRRGYLDFIAQFLP